MKKNYTLQLIESDSNDNKQYKNILSKVFDNIVTTTDVYESFEHYHHYSPDLLVLGSNVRYNEYEPFLKKVRKKNSTPVVILLDPQQINNISSILNYNFIYAILDKNYEKNIQICLDKALSKVKLIDKLMVGYNQKFSTLEKNKAVIENSKIPTMVTNSDLNTVKCNKSFLQHFDTTQEKINQMLKTQKFTNFDVLKNIINSKNLIDKQSLIIRQKEYFCKIYILKKFDLYMITFDSLLTGNELIDINTKKELETMLERVDKNFDDYVRLQYNMVELTSSVRSFLATNTEESSISQWLEDNKKLVETLEAEFDTSILEELKLQTYFNS